MNSLPHQLAVGLRANPSVTSLPSPLKWTPKNLRRLPLNELSVIIHAVSGSIAEIYRFAIPIGVLAVILSLTLPEIKLRTSLHPVADEIPMSNADPLL